MYCQDSPTMVGPTSLLNYVLPKIKKEPGEETADVEIKQADAGEDVEDKDDKTVLNVQVEVSKSI